MDHYDTHVLSIDLVAIKMVVLKLCATGHRGKMTVSAMPSIGTNLRYGHYPADPKRSIAGVLDLSPMMG